MSDSKSPGLACSICHELKPKSEYSGKQIKAKGKRKCKPCAAIASTQVVETKVCIVYACITHSLL